MTKPSSKSALDNTIGLNDRPGADFRRDEQADTADYAPFQPLITTAILATTAFRLRDDEALTEALRRLVQAVRPFEAGLDQK